MRRTIASLLALWAMGCGPSGQNGVLGTVDLGDNFVAPDLALDEDFFYCRIQPEVIERHGCATGNAGENGQCHESRSALQLLPTTSRPTCDREGRVSGNVPDEYVANYEAARFFVQTDPLTSPLYLRPINMASHPRRIFSASDPAARLITEWISSGAE